MSRTKNSIRNAAVSLIAQAVILMIQVYTRKLFINYLSVDYLGCNSLFSNIFSCMTIFEANSGALFSFMMYQAIAQNDETQICKILKINKAYNWIMGGIILVLTVPVCLSLPYIINNTTDFSWSFLRIVFILYLVKVELGLILGYHQIIFDTHQKNYICSLGNVARNIVVGITQIIAIAVFRNYIAYLLLDLAGYAIYYLFIRLYAKRQYSYINHKVIVERDFVKKTGIFKEFKNGIVHKIAHTIYGGTDSIVITAFLGLRDNALYSNYLLLRTQVVTLFSEKIMNSMSASIGNYVYDNQKRGNNKQLFYTLDMLGFWMASFCSFSFCMLCEPFICVVWGNDLLLNKGCLFLESILIYLTMVSSTWAMFRNSYGNYNLDRNLVIASAISNIVVSLSLVGSFGIAGILVGTAVGDLFQIAGYLKVVFLIYQDIDRRRFILRQVFRSLWAIVLMIITYGTCCLVFDNSILGLAYRAIICLILPNLVNIIIFRKKHEYEELKNYVIRIVEKRRTK